MLLATLANKVLNNLNLNINKKYFWTDSTIVISWLQSESSRWKTLVANRVSEIQSLTNVSEWYHVKGAENPADLVSRGVTAQKLIESQIWWQGPIFLEHLHFDPKQYKQLNTNNFNGQQIEERNLSTSPNVTIDFDILNKFSSFTKLQRIMALVFRFTNNCKGNKKRTGPL